jgi:hypothetical protein
MNLEEAKEIIRSDKSISLDMSEEQKEAYSIVLSSNGYDPSEFYKDIADLGQDPGWVYAKLHANGM